MLGHYTGRISLPIDHVGGRSPVAMTIQTMSKLILASSSPRRIELLKLMGLDFEVIPSCIHEQLLQGEIPEQHVRRLSAAKAHAIADLHRDAWIIGADTIVVLKDEILGKPTSSADARRMLMKLSGHEHIVFTGFTIIHARDHIHVSEVVASSVFFNDLSEDEVNWYVGTEEPYDKAGGYAIQGTGAFFIKGLSGSYTNVIGLPLCEVVDSLKRLGVLSFQGGTRFTCQ